MASFVPAHAIREEHHSPKHDKLKPRPDRKHSLDAAAASAEVRPSRLEVQEQVSHIFSPTEEPDRISNKNAIQIGFPIVVALLGAVLSHTGTSFRDALTQSVSLALVFFVVPAVFIGIPFYYSSGILATLCTSYLFRICVLPPSVIELIVTGTAVKAATVVGLFATPSRERGGVVDHPWLRTYVVACCWGFFALVRLAQRGVLPLVVPLAGLAAFVLLHAAGAVAFSRTGASAFFRGTRHTGSFPCKHPHHE
eukprot:tig00000403_g285.t1